MIMPNAMIITVIWVILVFWIITFIMVILSVYVVIKIFKGTRVKIVIIFVRVTSIIKVIATMRVV
jgi:hypothetical protein